MSVDVNFFYGKELNNRQFRKKNYFIMYQPSNYLIKIFLAI